jgi:hypothetical protein
MVKWEQEKAAKAFKEATSVTKEYNVQNTTVQAGLDKARKRVKEMAIELGEKLQPVMKHVLSSTTIMLKVLSTIVDFVIKYKTVLLTLTVAVVGYYTAVKLQYIWSLRLVAIQKLKAASMAIEDALLAASILKHKVLRGEITATAAAQTFFNKVLKMNPMGAAIAAICTCLGPVHKACGITSPKINKSVTEITTAVNRLKTLSKKTGKASIAKLFINNKVHKSQ